MFSNEPFKGYGWSITNMQLSTRYTYAHLPIKIKCLAITTIASVEIMAQHNTSIVLNLCNRVDGVKYLVE